MRIEKLAEDVEIVVGATFDSNATLFFSEQGALCIDALGSRADAEALRQYLEARGSPLRLFVLTHGFSDHLAALKAFAGVPAVAHRLAATTFARELYRTAEEAGFWSEPTIQISAPLDLRWGRYTLHIEPLGGHTESTLGIDVPALDAVFISDNVVGNIVYVVYGDRSRLRDALQWAQNTGRTRVIQGHGGVSGRESIASAIHYLDALERAAQVQLPANLPAEAWLPPGVRATDFERHFHRRNVAHLRGEK